MHTHPFPPSQLPRPSDRALSPCSRLQPRPPFHPPAAPGGGDLSPRLHVFDFEHFNIVGYNSVPNQLPLFCNTLPDDLVSMQPGRCVWEVFKQRGAVTMLADEVHDNCQAPTSVLHALGTSAFWISDRDMPHHQERPRSTDPFGHNPGLSPCHPGHDAATRPRHPEAASDRRTCSCNCTPRGAQPACLPPTRRCGRSFVPHTLRPAAGRRAASSIPAAGSAWGAAENCMTCWSRIWNRRAVSRKAGSHGQWRTAPPDAIRAVRTRRSRNLRVGLGRESPHHVKSAWHWHTYRRPLPSSNWSGMSVSPLPHAPPIRRPLFQPPQSTATSYSPTVHLSQQPAALPTFFPQSAPCRHNAAHSVRRRWRCPLTCDSP